MQEKDISRAVIKRLPRYYRYLGELIDDGIERISSSELSGRMKVTASQIRQDLNNSGKIVQLEYNWQHPKAGVVRVRCVGISAADSNGMVTLKGYHRVISNIIQSSFLDV